MAMDAVRRRDGLTLREVEVLQLLARGLTHRQIAGHLDGKAWPRQDRERRIGQDFAGEFRHRLQ